MGAIGNIKHLYIIGNGFDIHHGRKTSYSDFYIWSQENHGNDIADLEERLGTLEKDWWSDFENNLANVDAYEISQEIASENVPNLFDEHVDRQWNDAEIYTEQMFEGIYIDIKRIFEEWIQNGIKKPSIHRLVKLNAKDSYFISFNYTDTLEELYKIPQSQILHIHGSIYDDTFIIGHGKTREEISQENEYTLPSPPNIDFNNEEDYDDYSYEENGLQLHEQLALDAAISGVASQRKPVTDIIEKYKDIFKSFNDVTDIHIYGFSFSEIDMPYLEKIVKVVDIDNVFWEVSDYNNDNKNRIESFFKKNKINNYMIISLDDILVSGRQLKLF